MSAGSGANGGAPQGGAANAQGEAPGWRQRVNEQFIKRRQKPGMLEKNLAKVSQKIGPVRPVKLPILTKPTFADPAAEMRAALNKASFGQTAEQQAALANSAAAMALSPQKPKTPRDASAAAGAGAGAGAGALSARDSEKQRELLFGSGAASGRGAAPGLEDTKRAQTPPQQPALLPPGAQSFMQRNAAAAAATGAPAAMSSVLSPPRSGRGSGGGAISVSLGPAPLSTAPLPKYSLPKADKLYELTATDPAAQQSGPPLTGLAALAANTSLHHTLPLELFDSDETDKTPEEWVALSASKYAGAGVPARSLYYHNRQWKWAPCRVMEWNAVSEHFIITFPPNTHTKDVKRLSILFDGEDEKRFLARVERCRLLRDEAMSHRRLLQFIDHQPGDMFAPLQKTAVHGIIANLMRHSEKLVQARQKTVEGSLAEVRSEYARAMKAAIIDYKRRSPDEERKLLPLGLPPRTVTKAAPGLAVIDIPARLIQKTQVMRSFQTPDFHYTIHAAATAVILNLQTAWHSSLCRERFFQMDHAPVGTAGLGLGLMTSLIGSSGVSSSPLELPMTIEDYVMKQEIQFTSVRDKLVSDWRSHVISMIRETLKDIFHIYVDDRGAYDGSLFQRFLFMVQLMLRYQLAELVHQSLTDFAAFFERYAVRPPQPPRGGAVHYAVLPPASTANNAGGQIPVSDGSAPQPAAAAAAAAALDVKQPLAAPAPFKVMITADPSQAPAAAAAGSVAAAAAALPAVERVPRGSAAAAAAMLASARRGSGPVKVGAPRDDTDESEQFLLPEEVEPALAFPNPALYLHEFLSGAPSGPAAGLEDGVHPLFSFRMHAENGEIAFTPRLDSIEPAVLDVINIAEKVSSPGSDLNKTKTCVFEIESLVVPLLNKEDKPMCTKRNSAFIFRHGLNLKLRVRSIIRENLKLPRALAALYAEHRFLLHIEPDAYVKQWFAGTRKKPAPQTAADKSKRDEDKSSAQTRARDAKKDKKDAPKVVTKADKEKEAAEEAKRRADAERDMWEERSVDDTKREIERFRQAVIDIQNKSPNECVFRLCQIDVRHIKAQLIERANAIATKLMHGLAEHVRAQNQKIALQFEEIKKRISRRPNDVHELAELKNLVETVENVEIPRFQREIRGMQAKMAVLEDFQHRVSRDDFDLSWNVVRYPQYISEDLERTKERIQYDNAKFQKTLQSEQADFAQKLITMTEDVRRFADFGLGRVELMDEHTRGVLELNDALENAEKLVISFNDRDKLFGDPPTEYAELKELRRKFQPYFLLWNTTGHFKSSQNSWLGGQFLEVLQDPNEIERLVTGWHKLMLQLEKQFREEGAAKPAAVAADTLKHITAFKEHVPLIQWLRSPGLYQRHWERISKILNKQLDPENLTLQQILNLDVVTHRDEIEEECDFATKEFALENAKEKMRKAWETMLMQLQEYKSTGKFILTNSEDAFTLLDDHLIKTQAMLASPYVHRFWEKAMDAWRNKLKIAQHRLSVWMQVQKAWMYLEPIFTSMDIKRSLAKEADRFQQLDRFWLGFMERAKASQKDLLTFCSENEENFQKLQGGCLDTINDIMNKLNLYLDSKRQIFPRFYFLSNDGLLSLLSQTKDPTSVQPHLSKCFDAIRLLEFSSAAHPQTNPQGKLLIKGMHSVEGEFVPFVRDVDPNDGSKRGNVELWLIDVEHAMRESLRKSMYTAMVGYGNLPDDHTQWYFKYPAQVVLAVYRFMWSDAVNEALQHASGSGKALDVVKQHCDVQKRKLIELVQNPRLPALHRQTLEALMVLELNGNSIVAGLRASQVRSDTDFNWIKELRYSYDLLDEPAADAKHPGGGGGGHHHPTGAPGEDQQWTQAVLRVKMVNTTLDYQYEYLGNSSRLVITDLTTRCYQTLMTALKMHRGGAPEGPAGTGKTETVKDLSKALAIMCVVDNGSDSLTTRSMSRFFKGLASTGAWCCFDEFNRIDVEVLSVAAQQISGIQRAIIEKRKDVMFGDSKIALVPTCSVFVTMNPVGYSGRQELPDNLKTLFRTVAMILPEYRMIAEFRLMGSGYNSADTLAVKIVYALKLAQEQLSVQEHYDFGTRNIVSILKTAAGLKQKFPQSREDVLCVRAIRECNIPKLVAPDIPLFEGIMRDLFPDVPAAEADPIHDRLTAAIKRAMAVQKPPLVPTPTGIQKCLELYETILVRTGVMLVGPPFAGKSTALKVLAAALSLLADESAAANGGRLSAADAEHFNWVDCFFINPKAITKDQLFGRDDESKNEWTLGVLPVAMRAAVADQRSGRWKWVVLDGPVDSEWIENMNTVLDESRKLCLGSGDQIKLIDHMTMAFEVEDLAAASLATVSRCGMVYMEPASSLWRQLVESFVASLPASLDNYKADIRTLFGWIVPPCLEFIHRHCRLMLPTSDHALVAALTRMFASLLDEFFAAPLPAAAAPAAGADEKAPAAADAAAADAKDSGDLKALSKKKDPKSGKAAGAGAASNTPARSTVQPANPNTDYSSWLESLFLFSAVWSLGCCMDGERGGRARFSNFFRDLVSGKAGDDIVVSQEHAHRKVKMPYPEPTSQSAPEHDDAHGSGHLGHPQRAHPKLGAGGETVYDYVFNKQKGVWDNWAQLPDFREYKVPDAAQYYDIIVPTVASVRTEWLLELLVTHQKHVLLTGPTGTGKSLSIRKTLLHGLDDTYLSLFLSFSARTTANRAQDIIDGSLDRRWKGVIGPPVNKRYVIFLDDLNMPTPDAHGAQPPIEILRQWMDYGGWYDRTLCTFQQLVDIQFVAALGPPSAGGGRSNVTNRYLRHYNNICLTPYDSDSLRRIFTVMMDWWMRDFKSAIRLLRDPLLDASIGVYDSVLRELLPTPAKSHYTFNMRDLSRLFHGLLASSSEQLRVPGDLIKLWVHETTRVFADRLVDAHDTAVFFQAVAREFAPASAAASTAGLGAVDGAPVALVGAGVGGPLRIARELKDKDLKGAYPWPPLITRLIEAGAAAAAPAGDEKAPGASSGPGHRRRMSTLAPPAAEKPLLYCDFSQPEITVNKPYLEVNDMDRLCAVCEGYLVDYNNESNSKNFDASQKSLFGPADTKKAAAPAAAGTPTNAAGATSPMAGDRKDEKSPVASAAQNAQTLEKLSRNVNAIQSGATSQSSHNTAKKNMDLVLFTAAVEHISRISRILRQPRGHALLVGVGGSGRQSLCRLAAFVGDIQEVYQVEVTKTYKISDWQDDLRDMLKKAGTEDARVVFLFTDAQIKTDAFLEDINSFLQYGEIPNLFNNEQQMAMSEAVVAAARKVGKANDSSPTPGFAYFLERCRQNVHIVLCLSPVGDAFRNRLRMFPSLVNYTTIDWFHPWPHEALSSVATRFFKDIDGLDDSTKSGIVDLCTHMQLSTTALSEQFARMQRRHNYVTASSFLEMIQVFKRLFLEKRADTMRSIAKYKTGVDKLEETAAQVDKLNQFLDRLQPELKASRKETEELANTIQLRSTQVAMTKKIVAAEQKERNEQKEVAAKWRLECEAQLEEAMPAMQQAQKALKSLKKPALDELKSTRVPSQGLLLCMEALCVMMKVEPRWVGQAGQKKPDFWEPAKKKLLSSTKLFDKMRFYPKDNIEPDIIAKVRLCIKNPNFSPAQIAIHASHAAEAICKWVIAMEIYDRVIKKVQPKRELVAQAEKREASLSAQVAQKEAELKDVQALLDDLNTQLDIVNEKKKGFEAQEKECRERLDRAQKLTTGLKENKENWSKHAVRLEHEFQTLIGNIVLSSGVIAYLGAFTSSYREQALKGWIEQLSRHHITSSAPNYALHRVLADPLQEVKWELQGLPRDPFSFDNAVILSECNRVGRFCLLIDPHEQAVHWIRRFHAMRDAEAKDALTSAAAAGAADGKAPAAGAGAGDAKAAAPTATPAASGGSRSKGNERRLQEIKHNDTPANWKNRLQACMISGLPLLVEGVGETLDPILEPLLQKQKFKQNNRWMIRLGNEIVDFNPDFRLYLLSKMHNPHYPPEISTKVTVINFMVTQKGLEDQMLSKIMALEEAKLEENRIKKVEETADLTEKKQFLDENILRHLNYSKGHILDDVALIQDLAKSKSTSANYEKRMKQAQASQEVITQRRAHYSSLAQHVAGLFFCISELSQIDPMYQYSLRWYMALFVSAQQKGTPSVDLIEHKFNEMLYDNVCRSLFEKDKLLFAFLMCLNIQQTKKQIDADELRLLLTGGTALIDLRLHPNPTEVLDTATPTAGTNPALVNTVISGAANAAAAGARASGGPLGKGVDVKSGAAAAAAKGIDTKAAASSAGADAKTSARGSQPQPASGSSTGGSFDGESRKWLSDSSWLQLLQLSKLKAFSGLDAHFVEHQRTLWRAFYDSQQPVGVVPKLPVPWANTLNSFQRLLLLRCLRPDKLITAIQLYISEHMGERFIHPPHFNLSASYEDSSPYAPLIFVLSPGMDPYRDVHEFAAEKSPDRIFPISLGQGQEQEAEKLLRANFDKKSWVLLQNCHLLPSWMPKLEKLFEELCTSQSAEQASAASAIGATSSASALPAIDTGFRLWLTSRPDHRFPVSILQNGVKMTNEPPKGIKENLAATYADMKEKYFAPANNKRVEELKKLTFGVSFFHALVQERRKFGPIGWNVGYDFNRSDLAISKRQLKFYLRSMLTDTVPIAALRYLIGDLNYGGRVTDRWDKRTLSAMLEDCLNENVLRDEFVFDPNGGGFYHPLSGPTPAHTALDRYNKYIAELPTSDSAELFGLDDNASITSAITEAKQLLGSVLAVQPRVPSDADSAAALTSSTNRAGAGVAAMVAPVVDARAAAIDGVAREILAQLPVSFNLEAAAKKYPISYEECMNTVLVQELSRYNKLLDTIRSSLQNLQKAQAGLVLMSADLEQLSSALYDGRVAPSWMRVAYPSLKPLSAWILDLLKRIRMFTEWLRVGPPVVHCLSYFFNPQAFLTGTQQNYARGGPVSIDDLTFELEVVPDIQADHKVPPQDGCYVYGLYLEGARWDTDTKALAEPFKRQLYSPMPVLFLKPIERSKQAGKRDQTLTYNCPVYRTSKRSGALQSTGLSSNFVIDLNLRSYHPERYWVKRGVALLLQLDN